MVGCACDWGPSVPLAVPRTACEMRRRGHDESLIEKIIFEPQIFSKPERSFPALGVSHFHNSASADFFCLSIAIIRMRGTLN